MKAETDSESKAAATESGSSGAGDLWDQIRVGSIVLYGGDQVDDGWWEVVVVAVAKDRLTLRWRGALKEKAFKADRRGFGIIGPVALKRIMKDHTKAVTKPVAVRQPSRRSRGK